ncbi:glycosyltransferase family 4 protein [Flavobacterium sp.]|uniref:glycosyltransferase family 4 protein n=1 Tax=Flavobacterium sp. TaxID=239 RepID=UPI001B63007B|nr:glycosyltransferase family 4 protein [Flavobacterium sp.]MBP6128311.1 glycosyltransferase family 4 protein [Flavobacterium sp.]
MKTILVIHQSAELYGSDKTMLYFLSELDKTKYLPIIVLPFDGPLKIELEKNNIKVVIAPVLKLYRKMFTPKNIFKFIKEYYKGIKILNALNKEYKFDLVYTHTLAALIGILFAKKRNIKHLWHVQEIIAKPKVFNFLFKKILSLDCNHKVVYDSIATMNFWIENNLKLTEKSEAVWNGIETKNSKSFTDAELNEVRENYFFATNNEIVIALVGRINSWKGQQLLLQSFKTVIEKHKNIKLVYLGSAPPNQPIFETELRNKIKEYNLESNVILIPFQKEIEKFWNSIDIAVVPSTEPEPFGMVVIEAMLAKKPVIASNHGGPTEIVVENETGLLFEPNNHNSLSDALEKLIKDEQLRKLYGANGFKRVHNTFSLENHVNHFEKIFEELFNK